jgi:ABC-type glycerol-3-phosphate transport system permease component
MVPYATLLIPLYVLLNGLGLQNSLIGLSLVLVMFQLPFATYMMRISFEAVPRELEESALVDGCGTFSVLWRILLPSVRPGLITVGLFAFPAALERLLRSPHPTNRQRKALPGSTTYRRVWVPGYFEGRRLVSPSGTAVASGLVHTGHYSRRREFLDFRQ